MRLALAQIDPVVGDLPGNVNKIIEKTREARAAGADVVIFPEMALTGYPPEDLLLKPQFISDNLAALQRLAQNIHGPLCIVGFVEKRNTFLYNAAAVIGNGRVLHTYRKMCLPNYGVFDEKRYFSPGKEPLVVKTGGMRLGLSICEDVWVDKGPVRHYAKKGIDVLINISASPYHTSKIQHRKKIMARWARFCKAYGVYLNLVGGQDELVFDGGSFLLNPAGQVAASAPQFKEALLIADIPSKIKTVAPALKPVEEIRQALVLGIRDYVNKNRFSKVALGISGGIDSALVATLAVEALGKDRVVGVTMPSKFTSGATLKDSQVLARNLGIRLITLSIKSLVKAYGGALKKIFKGTALNIAEENLQARIRGTLMMALSNKFGWLILTTGNKSEISTGYCTLYGDTAGGFAAIKDVPKMTVYQLAEHINKEAGRDIIPCSTIRRAPTAELKANQKDQDTLPPYPVLDRLIKAYVEEDQPVSRILGRGVDEATVRKVIRMVDLNEYKRRQTPPGIKITPKAFGKDRRMPITNLYKP